MKQIWPAPERNKEPILKVLTRVLPSKGRLLEIASGSGQHAAWFAQHLPGWTIQPSELDDENFMSINAWVDDTVLANLHAPIEIDVLQADWEVQPVDAVFCANMIHIAPWECALGLLDGARAALNPGGRLILYGPYQIDGVHTAPSNESFDAGLRQRDPRWGVRDLTVVIAEAQQRGLNYVERVAMPANNFTVVFERASV